MRTLHHKQSLTPLLDIVCIGRAQVSVVGTNLSKNMGCQGGGLVTTLLACIFCRLLGAL